MKECVMKRNGRVLDLLKLLTLIETESPKSVLQLVEKTDSSRSVLMRLLRLARDELNVQYAFVRSQGYIITNWGVLNRELVLKSFASTFDPKQSAKPVRKGGK
jgi:hypothetical protein